jgi:hypothetical protein
LWVAAASYALHATAVADYSQIRRQYECAARASDMELSKSLNEAGLVDLMAVDCAPEPVWVSLDDMRAVRDGTYRFATAHAPGYLIDAIFGGGLGFGAVFGLTLGMLGMARLVRSGSGARSG